MATGVTEESIKTKLFEVRHLCQPQLITSWALLSKEDRKNVSEGLKPASTYDMCAKVMVNSKENHRVLINSIHIIGIPYKIE